MPELYTCIPFDSKQKKAPESGSLYQVFHYYQKGSFGFMLFNISSPLGLFCPFIMSP